MKTLRTRRDFLKAAGLGAVAVLAPGSLNDAVAAKSAGKAKPNIIVVLVDDMGFSDIGCYGGEIPTPNLDKLAANGVRFTQFYNTARCCPARASLLTGLYPHQAGVGHMMNDDGVPGYRGHLNDKCVTIAEVLRPAGYFTAMSGKWHVGQDLGVVPWERGFERSLNAAAGGFYFAGKDKLFLNGNAIADDDPVLPKNWYTTDLWTDFGIKFIDEALAAKKPFYLHLCHNAPHFPLQAPQDEIAKFRGKYKTGWDKLREQRHAKQIELGIMDKSWPMSPRPEEVKAWDSLTAEEQDRFDHIMAIYAAVVAHMDTAVGRLVEALKKRGVLDNTLIMFMSDNGGNFEGGPDGRFKGDEPGSAKSTVFCGQSWATLENTPLRRYKHYSHEGGISTPLIVHWPEQIKTGGELRRQPGHLIDIMATCVDVAGAKYPREFNGKPILPMEGISLVDAMKGGPVKERTLFWEHEGGAGIRVGDWKLVRLRLNSGDRSRGALVELDATAWELYDMKTDRTELNNLAGQKTEIVKDLAAKWEAWAKRAQVTPYPVKNRKVKNRKGLTGAKTSRKKKTK